MSERPLHDWTDKELEERERLYPIGYDPTHGWNLGAEINRRRVGRNQRYVLTGVIMAAVSATASMIAAIASLVSLYLRK